MEQAVPIPSTVETEDSTSALDMRKLGMWLYLSTEIILFSGFIVAFLSFRLHNPAEQQHLLNIPATALNTFVLIISSLTLVLALAAIQKGNQRGMRLGLIATGLLGAIFLGLQAVEWTSLFQEHMMPGTSTFANFFFAMTGFHGMHVFAGVLWLLLVLRRAIQGAFSPDNNMAIELFGLYWHFVDLVWIILFTIIYLV